MINLDAETLVAIGGVLVGIAGTVYGYAKNVQYKNYKKLYDEYVEARSEDSEGGAKVTPRELGDILDAGVDVYKDALDGDED